MNNLRRKCLEVAIKLLEKAESVIGEVRGEEQKVFESLPHSLAKTSKACYMEECISSMQEIQSNLKCQAMDLEKL